MESKPIESGLQLDQKWLKFHENLAGDSLKLMKN